MVDDAPAEKIRVAIVGGGCAGIAAAWALAAHPDHEIHVYEKSWRLGGKGASVRADDGRILEHGLHVWLGFYENAFRMMRECYTEVERRGWGPHSDAEQKLTHGRMEDAFQPEPHAGVADPAHQGNWAFWSGLFPAAEGLPGEPIDERSNPFTLPNYLMRVFGLLRTLMQSVVGPATLSLVEDASGASPGAVTVLVDRMASFLRVGALTGAAALVQAISILETWMRDFAPPTEGQTWRLFDPARELVEAVAAQIRKTLADLAAMDPEVRMKAEIIDIVMTIGAGLIRERILFDPRGLDAINDVDYRAWLKRNGATDFALNSRFIVGAYDFVFGYRNGDRDDPQLAAGIALRGAFRMFFTYRGSMVWRMGSGMGDAVFAPLYQVLKEGRELTDEPAQEGAPVRRRMTAPVTFHFLHELESVRFDRSNGEKRFVTSLNFRTRGPADALDKQSRAALDDYGHWPKTAEARFPGALAKTPAATTKTISKDFHRVVLALGVDDLAAQNDGRMAEALGEDVFVTWDRMMKTTGTVATRTAQVWLRADGEALGWNRGPGIITALGRSFSSWGDMSVTLSSERSRSHDGGAPQRARSVHYFCDVMADEDIFALHGKVEAHGDPLKNALKEAAGALRSGPVEARADERDHHKAIRKLLDAPLPKPVHGAADKILRRLLEAIARLGANPDRHTVARLVEDALHAVDDHLFEAVVDRHMHERVDTLLTREMREAWPRAYADGRTPIDLEVGRHVQANLRGSERYTQSLPGTIEHRISPLDRSAENMSVAGDWTACGLDMGCVEAAVMSGLLAAHATSGTPERHTIVGFDHP